MHFYNGLYTIYMGILCMCGLYVGCTLLLKSAKYLISRVGAFQASIIERALYIFVCLFSLSLIIFSLNNLPLIVVLT